MAPRRFRIVDPPDGGPHTPDDPRTPDDIVRWAGFRPVRRETRGEWLDRTLPFNWRLLAGLVAIGGLWATILAFVDLAL